jgi:Tol biopolymer transport system component
MDIGEDGDDRDIFVVDADGSHLRSLTQNRRIQDDGPSWSPDGNAIAFTRSVGPRGNGDVYVMNADGSGERNLTHTPGVERLAAWSPKG